MIKFILGFLVIALVKDDVRSQHYCTWCRPTGDCISNSMICDGRIDCPDGSDELGCRSICPYPQYYRCSDTGMCIDSYHVCDGIIDCPNAEDEDVYQCGVFGHKRK